MKTRFYVGLIALAALAFVGCAKDEVKSSVDNAIEFGTYLGRDAQTKGSIINNTVATGLPFQGFGVYAYYTGQTAWNDYDSKETPNFMNNEKVTSTDGENWSYDIIKYWPNNPDDKVSFFAYAPHSAGTTANPVLNEDGKIDFKVPADVTNHIDLVAADKKDNIDLTKQSVTGKVEFTFKHALARVGFKVEAVIDEINDQGNSATPDTDNQNNDIATGTVISVQEVELIGTFNTAGTLNLDGSTWDSTIPEATSYKLEYADFVKAVADNVTTTKQNLNKDSEYMMLIPTNVEANKVKIRVKYTVTTTDEKLSGGKSEIVNDITSDEFAFLFRQGKAYNFVLHLGLTSVKLDAEVIDWEAAADYVVNVPINF